MLSSGLAKYSSKREAFLKERTTYMAYQNALCPRHVAGRTIRMTVASTYLVNAVKAKVMDSEGIPEEQQSLFFAGMRLEVGRPLSQYNIQPGCTITLALSLRGGKPVVYLFPPASLARAIVTVTLVPQWTFTHTYPVTPAKHLADGAQHITWTVSAERDGTLTELTSGLEVTSLFWEAETGCSNGALVSPPPSPRADLDANTGKPNPELAPEREATHFDPANPTLTPSTPTTVLLARDAVLPYLDRALRTLGLHTAARTEFLTH